MHAQDRQEYRRSARFISSASGRLAQDVQPKLRDELLSFPTDTPSTTDDLSASPYLYMVVKQTLRLHTLCQPCPQIATEYDVTPVANPYTDRLGDVCNYIGWMFFFRYAHNDVILGNGTQIKN